MEPLGALSGAAGGMADAVAGIIEQRLRQTQVANQLAETQARNTQAQAALAETQRAHQADEATRQQLANQLGAYQKTEADNAATARTTAANTAYQGILKTIPTGTRFSDQSYQTALGHGALPEQFGGYQPPTLGMSTPTGEQGPAPEGRPFLGIQSELDKAAKLSPTETLSQNELDARRIYGKPKEQWTPADQALIAGYEGDLKAKGAGALQRMNISLAGTNTRQENSLANTAIQHEFDAVQKKIDGLKFPQAANLIETLNSPGGVADVVAVPEFLSSMAGGVGRGLRMTQAELGMIQNARPGIESVEMKLKNLAGNYQALTPDQRAQMIKLTRSVAEREARLSDMYGETQQNIINATTPMDARKHINDLNAKENALYRGLIGIPSTTTPGTTPPPTATGALPTNGTAGVAGGLQWRVKPPSD